MRGRQESVPPPFARENAANESFRFGCATILWLVVETSANYGKGMPSLASANVKSESFKFGESSIATDIFFAKLTGACNQVVGCFTSQQPSPSLPAPSLFRIISRG